MSLYGRDALTNHNLARTVTSGLRSAVTKKPKKGKKGKNDNKRDGRRIR